VQWEVPKAVQRRSDAILDSWQLGASDREVLNEAIADALLPSGYLSVKYGFSSKPEVRRHGMLRLPLDLADNGKVLYWMRKRLAATLYPTVVAQLQAGRTVMEGQFLSQSIAALLKVKEEYSRLTRR